MTRPAIDNKPAAHLQTIRGLQNINDRLQAENKRLRSENDALRREARQIGDKK